MSVFHFWVDWGGGLSTGLLYLSLTEKYGVLPVAVGMQTGCRRFVSDGGGNNRYRVVGHVVARTSCRRCPPMASR